MKITLYLFISFIFITTTPFAQQNPATTGWTLQQCVEYAIKNNISVKQADVQARFDKLTLNQSKLSVYPNVNSQHNAGYQFGRSIDRSSNQFATGSSFGSSHSVNVDADLFNWFRKKNTIEANEFLYQAGVAKLEKARNDIALNVANAYLAALLNHAQINVAELQMNQSKEQVANIDKQVKAGALPELNLAEMQTQLANDSATFITAKSNYILSLLQLKALLNIDAAAQFDIAVPPVETIPVEALAELDPAIVYESAVRNLPQQKINALNVKAAEKNTLVAKAGLYPSLSIFGSLSTNYSNRKFPIYEPVLAPSGIVKRDGNYTRDTVYSPTLKAIDGKYQRSNYFNQIDEHFGQSLGISLNIPIFNGASARTNWKKAQLNVESQQLLKEQDSRTLKQDIYQAHANAVAALEKYNASAIAATSAQKTYDFSRKRFDVGLLKPIDLITNQNNLFRTKINMLSAQYDYVFKMKLLEFYKGLGLKL